ncbi:CU044_5270 family protein [Micromonospora sp. CPCC 205539]|uniref:CU044_5270 family protein n=1 Tax=Micromonospora sp. CPCC 205539 TaxID=3122408 RepID=UPI002FF3EC4C
MSRKRAELTMLADARPRRLDPAPGSRPDASRFTAHPQPAAGRAAGWPTRRVILAGVAPTVAVVAAGAVFLTAGTTGGGTGPQAGLGASSPAVAPSEAPATATAGPVPRTARELLLVAAKQSATGDAATGGRYWVLEQEHGVLHEVGPKSRRYRILDRSSSRLWYALSPSDEGVNLTRELGAAPFTAEDRAAWQADGSPTQWALPMDVPDAPPSIVTSAPGPEVAGLDLSKPHGAGKRAAENDAPYYLAGGPISAAELAGLPTEPATLKARLLQRFKTSEIESASDYSLFTSAKSLVFDLPVSPQVRAAAYRMLADMRGVTALGAVTDQRGRSGMAVAFARKGDGGNWVQTRLIIDHRTGQALAEESWDLGTGRTPKGPGTFRYYSVVLRLGFTDDIPPKGQTTQKRR